MGDRKLDGQVALVIGGGGGIGGAIASRFAREGANVIVADLNGANAISLAAKIGEAGGKAIGLATDVANAESVANAVRRSLDAFSKLTVLVNVAAAPTFRGTVETLAQEEWERTFAVNLNGAFLACRHCIPAFRKAGGGAIINIASQLGHLGAPGMAAYCTSKAALIFLTRMLAVDHACDGIRANSISPGAVATERLDHAFGGDRAAAVSALGSRHLLGRLGTADEVASMAVFLASAEASFITGADFLVDGGYVAFKGEVDAGGRHRT